MIVSDLSLTNFRSHPERSVSFGDVTVIVGPNGIGKTNILESLWMLATTRSFRTNKDSDVIRWGEPAAHIVGSEFALSIAREPITQKIMKIEGTIRRPLEYLGELCAVLFTPDSLRIITGEPSFRRRFLDILLAQRQRHIARHLNQYRQVIRERNALLHMVALGLCKEDELEPWDHQLAALGGQIIEAREAMVEKLAPSSSHFYQTISGQTDALLSIRYDTTAARDPKEFLGKLLKARRRELQLQTSLIGPHRDDLKIELNGHPMGETSSRGEIRSALLAMKWAEAMVNPEKPPLLLLDDLFSELDVDRRAAFEDLIRSTQTVMTTTEATLLSPALQKRAQIIELRGEAGVSL